MENSLLNNLLTLSLFATHRLWTPPHHLIFGRNGPKEAATKTDKWWIEDAQLVCSLKRRLASVLATTKALGGLGCFLPNSFRCSSVGIVRLGTASHRTALKQDSITRVTKKQCWGSACFWASWIQIPIHLSEGRIRIRLWIRLRILPFSHKCVDIMFAKLDFTTKVEKKIKFLRLKMMCLWASYKKKIWKQQNVFCILKINEERSRIRSCFWIWIHWSEIRIRGPGSAQNCHRSPTLLTNFFPVQIHKY